MSDKNLEVFSPENLEMYKKYDDMAKTDNTVYASINKLPILKIQYDDESKFDKGVWVLGQVKKDGKIIEEGRVVSQIVILRVKNKYLYIKTENNKNLVCSSPLFNQGERIEGNFFHNECGKNCKYRNEIKDKCKAQKVVYACAVVKNDEGKVEMIDCIMYMKGTSYMPFVDYISEASILEIEDKSKTKHVYNLPYYSFITNLGSGKEKNQSVNYFIAKFTRGKILSEKDVSVFSQKAVEVDKYIEEANVAISKNSFVHDDESEVPSNASSSQNAFKSNESSEVSKSEDVVDTGSAVIVDDEDFFN